MKYGLIGEHLGHSFSKQIQTRIAEIENVKDYDYQLVELNKEEFKEFMEKKDFKGINVTIPYKKDVIPYLDEMDESAKAIGAVNTIVNVDGKLKGFNTDFGGFLYMVKAHNVHMEGKKVLIIGNGGACAAVKAVCEHENAKDIVIVSRSANRGAISYDEMYTSHLDADIVVNTSPVGMFPNIVNAPIDVSWFHKLECVLDVVYNPILTRLCFEAQEADIKRVIGLEMLIAQAKYTFEIFENMSFDDSIIDEIKKEMLKDRCNSILEWDGERCEAEENPQIATYEDHRMAMAFAPLALVRPAGIEIMHPEVVSKSYPHYWEHLTEAGFLIEEKTE